MLRVNTLSGTALFILRYTSHREAHCTSDSFHSTPYLKRYTQRDTERCLRSVVRENHSAHSIDKALMLSHFFILQMFHWRTRYQWRRSGCAVPNRTISKRVLHRHRFDIESHNAARTMSQLKDARLKQSLTAPYHHLTSGILE